MNQWFPRPPRNPFGNTHEQALDYIRKGKNWRNRRIGSTSYLAMLDTTTVGLVLHHTVVVAYHEDGTYTLDHGGYCTRTTSDFINTFTPFSIYSNYGGPRAWVLGYTGKNTPSKVQMCRTCGGTGFDSWLLQRYRKEHPGSRRLSSSELGVCHRCDGAKRVDYGNKPIPILWKRLDAPVRMTVRKRQQRNVLWLASQQVLETDAQRFWAPEFDKMPPPWRAEYVIQGF